jgi:hypothetical protein
MRSRPAALILLFLLALILAAAVGVARAQALDFTRTDYSTGNLPSGVVVADLNRDGRPDLATANHGYGYGISVLLGSGGGAFSARTDFTADAGPYAVATGDVNNDGKLDLVTANDQIAELGDLLGGSVSVLLGNGGGGFGARTDFATGAGACDVAVADFNGDGRPDVATANGAEGDSGSDVPDNSVSVLLGNGGGGFAAPFGFATGANPRALAVGDFNKDGKLDLVTANGGTWSLVGNSVSVLLGNGSGGFARTDFTTGSFPVAVAVGDLNKDSKPDLVTANEGSGTVSVLLGNGSGGFAPKVDYAMGSSSFSPRSVAVADLNGDANPDVATSNNRRDYYVGYVDDYSGVLVRLGNGSGTLAGGAPLGGTYGFATGMAPCELVAADLNGDGRQDMVTANWHSHNVSVLLQQGVQPPSSCRVTLTLSGLRKGVLKFRRKFTARGKVTSANLSATKAKLTLQRKKGTKWVKVKIVSRTLSATHTYSWKYKPPRKGTYRIRATVARTATNKSATSKWKTFRVR